MEAKEVNVTLSQAEVTELIILVEDRDKEAALDFCKGLKKKLAITQSGMRSVYQRGGHIGAAKLR
ncbi:MAG: hypothetical protein QME81_16575 [bacterium]|nr:hypothetical protein [bacterium]